jgi:hypothetical protein
MNTSAKDQTDLSPAPPTRQSAAGKHLEYENHLCMKSRVAQTAKPGNETRLEPATDTSPSAAGIPPDSGHDSDLRGIFFSKANAARNAKVRK